MERTGEHGKEGWGWEGVRLRTSYLHWKFAYTSGVHRCDDLDAHARISVAVLESGA